NAVELWIHCEKFAADALDVRSDGGIVDDDRGVAHEAVAVLDMTRKLGERVHHPELGQREIDACILPLRVETLQIEQEVAALDDILHRLRRRQEIATTEQCRDARREVRQAR